MHKQDAGDQSGTKSKLFCQTEFAFIYLAIIINWASNYFGKETPMLDQGPRVYTHSTKPPLPNLL